MEREPELED